MPLDSAQLSSLTTSVGELVDRISRLAEDFQSSPREDVAADLYDVERNLKAAHRRLNKLVQRL